MGATDTSSPQSQIIDNSDKKPITIALIGAGSEGKSSFVKRFVNGTFEDIPGLLSEGFFEQKIQVDGQTVHLSVVDTAGRENYDFMRMKQMQEAQGFILMFSLADEWGYYYLERSYDSIKHHSGRMLRDFILVATKADATRFLPEEEIDTFVKLFEMPYIETSAKTGQNVTEAIRAIVKACNERKDRYLPEPEPVKKTGLWKRFRSAFKIGRLLK
eukprot:TRINITY_DN1149_c0_g2_i1.p1 TRINITY_DN1149_c0_g2~~TRINITY_DN1149_c0_g2_i1.p1  ORF type:complete len:235 (-),score=64.84 TRINITY_DN1149_c0_g2_i1:47-691(-)